jgi:hypothetical protein
VAPGGPWLWPSLQSLPPSSQDLSLFLCHYRVSLMRTLVIGLRYPRMISTQNPLLHYISKDPFPSKSTLAASGTGAWTGVLGATTAPFSRAFSVLMSIDPRWPLAQDFSLLLGRASVFAVARHQQARAEQGQSWPLCLAAHCKHAVILPLL